MLQINKILEMETNIIYRLIDYNKNKKLNKK